MDNSRELQDRLRDVLKAVRLLKSRSAPWQSIVPSGTSGVLAAVEKVESGTGCHSKDLAAACALDPSTISRAVAALVRAGLVVRTADPADGRASRLALTPRGRQALDEIERWYDRLLSDALRDWPGRDVELFAGLLQRFSTDLITRVHTDALEAAR